MALQWIHQRNHYVKLKLPHDTDGLAAGEEAVIEMIKYCNENIIKFLNL